jgi:hypothetical protein
MLHGAGKCLRTSSLVECNAVQLLSCCVASLNWLRRPLHICSVDISIIPSFGRDISAHIQENYIGCKDTCYTGYIDVAIPACYTNY